MRNVRRNETCEHTQAGVGESETDHTAQQRKHYAFHQQLFHQTRAVSPEREPQRDFLLPNRGAREQQIGDIRACDEEHERDRA